MVTVASLLQIMDQVDSLDSSCDLQPIRAKNFVNRLHLVFYACVQTCDVMVLAKFFLANTAFVAKQKLRLTKTPKSRHKARKQPKSNVLEQGIIQINKSRSDD